MEPVDLQACGPKRTTDPHCLHRCVGAKRFATSGPRIRVRFFGGSNLPKDVTTAADPVAVSYTHGVPMGGMLEAPSQNPPTFFLWAARDPNSAWLQRAQIIKGRLGGEAGKWFSMWPARMVSNRIRQPTAVPITAPVFPSMSIMATKVL